MWPVRPRPRPSLEAQLPSVSVYSSCEDRPLTAPRSGALWALVKK